MKHAIKNRLARLEGRAFQAERTITVVIDFGPSDIVEVWKGRERYTMTREEARMLSEEGNRVIWVVGVSPKLEGADIGSNFDA